MLGPLPTLYRWIVCALALLGCVGVGAWLAFALPVPLLAPAGAAIGGALGVLVVLALLSGATSRETARARDPRHH